MRLVDVVRLAGNLLAAWQDRLGLAEADDRDATLVPGDGPLHEIALHADVFVVDRFALGFANLLDHHLLGRLGGDAAQLSRLDLDLDRLAFAFLLLDVHLAGVAVDDDADARLLAVLLLGGELHGGLDAGEDDFAVDVLVVVHDIHESKQVRALHFHRVSSSHVVPRGPSVVRRL